MALRDQPYLPLYIQDIMTDEKLNECCAATHGIFIKGVMCLMHKSDPYGKILLKQKYKQTDSKERNFAIQLAKQLPYTVDEICSALTELIAEGVCQFDGDYLVQKRMVSDGELSDKRAKAGKKGGENAHKFAKANNEANTEYANEIEINYILNRLREYDKESISTEEAEKLFLMLVLKMIEVFRSKNPDYFFHKETDYTACLQIAYNIAHMKKWPKATVINGKMDDCLKSWQEIVDFVKDDKWFSGRSLADISTVKEWQRLVQQMKKNKNGTAGKFIAGKDDPTQDPL